MNCVYKWCIRRILKPQGNHSLGECGKRGSVRKMPEFLTIIEPTELV